MMRNFLFSFMFYVYILYSKQFGKTYTGYTSDLNQRMMSHNELANNDWTKRYRPWMLLYQETYATKSAAMARERFFKSGKGREIVKAKVEEYLKQSS